MITATYRDAHRKIITITKAITVCPISGGDFPPGDEFSAQATLNRRQAKSPNDQANVV